jgi:hypothetical protein
MLLANCRKVEFVLGIMGLHQIVRNFMSQGKIPTQKSARTSGGYKTDHEIIAEVLLPFATSSSCHASQ